MQFKALVGQGHIVEQLRKTVDEQRVSHAMLFNGPEGSGTLTAAIAYAQYVNCTNRQDGDSCGICPSCKKMNKLAHPDLHFVYPVAKTTEFKTPISANFSPQWRTFLNGTSYVSLQEWYKTLDLENKQGSIFVHESNEIIKNLSLVSYEAEYKVVILWMAEQMNVECANKLLKIIEEPPQKTLFILITENEERLISTIRSRVQLVQFGRISPIDMKDHLLKDPKSTGKNIDNIVHLSNGNYTKALSLLNPKENTDIYFDHFCNIMRLAYKRDWDAMFKWSEELTKLGRESQKSFIVYALRMFRENFMLNLQNDDIVYLNEQERAFSERFSPFINERNIITFCDEFERAYQDISRNGNSKIIFADLAFKIVKVIRL